MITDAYQAQLEQLHRESERWGSTAHRYAGIVNDLATRHEVRTILDYGCGKQALAANLAGAPYKIIGYDPGIPGVNSLPNDPCDMVVSCDVLEHIEPEHLDAVLATIEARARKVIFLVIALYAVDRKLPDGRGVHLIVETADWWLAKLAERMPGWKVEILSEPPQPTVYDHTGRERRKKPALRAVLTRRAERV